MILANLGLVRSLCSRFVGRGVDYEDLFQAGCEGLMKAAAGYNPDLGFAFSTYAVPYILGELKKVVRENHNIRMPRAAYTLYGKLMAAKEELYRTTGSVPTVSQLAAHLNISPEKVVELLQCAGREVDDQLEDVADKVPVKDSNLEVWQNREWVKSAVDSLPKQEQTLISLRYFHGMTQQQTGKILHMTQVQVSRAERRILEKLKIFLEE